MTNKSKRTSTHVRYNLVIGLYNNIIENLGKEVSNAVSKQYIYDKIKDRTGLCTKTIAYIINHVYRND